MVIAGLTGGIASGKSTVADFFHQAGARIVDADEIARQAVRQGSPAWREIVASFGAVILQPDKEIDRVRLGDIIFNDPRKKARLETIVHPRVAEHSAAMIARFTEQTPDAVVIMDVPLLLEAGMDKGLKTVIVVYVPEAVQLARLMRRDAFDESASLARIRSQMPLSQKCRRATFIIDNSGSLADTRTQTLTIFQQLVQSAPNGRAGGDI